MEIANQLRLRESRAEDAKKVRRLLEKAPFAHWHIDWQLPGDWLGTPNFVVAENEQGNLIGGLLATPDPPPAAWVRVAAFRSGRQAPALIGDMIGLVITPLREQGVDELGWLLPVEWPDTWLVQLGFQQITSIVSWIKPDMTLPNRPVNPGIHIRPVHEQDLPVLAEIEAVAFEPLWRHSLQGLEIGRRSAFTFEVAEWQGEIAGFQYSTFSRVEQAAHLVRMTVSPQVQGQGIGSALLTRALQTYRQRGLQQVTLNTQIDNTSSHRLYSRFGFYQEGPLLPVWARPL